jgi:hypothetical protein
MGTMCLVSTHLSFRTHRLQIIPAVTQKDKRKGQELRWEDLVSDAALAVAMNASLSQIAQFDEARPNAKPSHGSKDGVQTRMKPKLP